MFRLLYSCFFGPRPYGYFIADRKYDPTVFEGFGNNLVSFAIGAKNVCIVFSWLLVPYAIRNWTVSDTLLRVKWLLLFTVIAYTTRAMGRFLK